jgi:putative serine protease PepD
MSRPSSLWADTRPPEIDPPPPPPPAPAAPPPPPPRRRIPVAAIAAGAAVVLAAAALVVTLGKDDSGTPTAAPAGGGSAKVAPIVSSGGATRSSTVEKVAAATSAGVVQIRAGSATGTGFVVGADGTIVTNAHVVGSNDTVQVRFNDGAREVTGRVLGTDQSSDLAVLRVDPSQAGPLTVLRLADSDDVQVGDLAIAIGYPFGLDRTVTAGIVSGVGRSIQAPDGFSIDHAIQTDAAINPGNSGGPLLDERGSVIGVNAQIESGGNGRGNVGIGFAVPSNDVLKDLPALRRGQTVKHPYLGISQIEDPSGGSRVAEVVPGGPADEAGIEPGDVVVSVGGNEVQDPNDVASALDKYQPGDHVKVEVRRGSDLHSLEVELGNRPARSP